MPRRQPIKLPSAEYLRTCFEYDPDTGELRWKKRPREHFANDNRWASWNKVYPGNIAGHTVGRWTKYSRITIGNMIYMTHRVIYKIVTGNDPVGDIDHEDRNPLNNRRDNLREATRRQAVWNRNLPRTINPYRGVFPTKGNHWRARIRVNGVQKHLGTFSTPEEASAAYEAAARVLHGDFYCPT